MTFPPSYFRGSNQFSLSFDFRTEQKNGILIFTFAGPSVFFLVQLLDGSLFFEYKTATYRDSLTYSASNVPLCDGKWRTVGFSKIGLRMSVTVTGGPPMSMGSQAVSSILYTTSKVYIGGIKPGSDAEKFMIDNNLSHMQGSECAFT